MGLGGYLLHQFARPHGRLAGVVAALMNRGNALINARAIAALQLADGVRVLEVGFGGAAALGTLLGDGRVSFAAGLDPPPSWSGERKPGSPVRSPRAGWRSS